MTDFSLFCDLVQACHSLSLAKPAGRPRTGKETLRTATAFFTEWTATALPRPFAPGTGAIVFRLLFPDLDVRRRYNLKETILARNLVKLFGLSTRPGSRGHALLSWKSDGDDQEDFPRPGCLGLEVQGILAPAVCRVLVLVDGIPDLQQSQIKRSTMTLESIDELLDELATHSPYSQLGHTIPSTRSARDILRALYADVAPFEAAVLTQIILKDLHPMLYPLPALSTSTALLQYDSASLEELDLRTAMRIWHWAMLPVYNVRADLDRAATIVEAIPKERPGDTQLCRDILQNVSTPELGVPVEVPKAVKGQSCDMAIRNFARGSTVYVETKYDGERMQIHIDIDKPMHEQIAVFSKSKRNSTQDRRDTLPIIRAALGLPPGYKAWPSLLASRTRRVSGPAVRSAIVEAEMVAYSERGGCIDEFHTVGRLLGRPQGGEAWNRPPATSSQATSESSPSTSQTTGVAAANQNDHKPERSHLALVFFDLLYLDGQSYLEESYEARRATLEQVVRPIVGFSMLAASTAIIVEDPARAIETLAERFSACLEAREEGLFLKAGDSTYNDYRKYRHWLKLKKDYIPGLGDTGSFCVIGGGWDKERGRQLGVAPSTYTSWFIGLQTNRRECLQIPSTKPHYHVLFVTHSYNLQRQQLEQLNFVVNSKERCKLSKMLPKVWPYTLHFAGGLSARPTFVLAQPAVFELYGAGWTKSGSSKYYELRWPRVIRYHFDRQPSEALSRDEVQELAMRAATTSVDDARSDAESAWDSACEDFAACGPIVAVSPTPPSKRTTMQPIATLDRDPSQVSSSPIRAQGLPSLEQESIAQLPTPPPTSQPEAMIEDPLPRPYIAKRRRLNPSSSASSLTETRLPPARPSGTLAKPHIAAVDALALLFDESPSARCPDPPVLWAIERSHDPLRWRRRLGAHAWRLTCADSVVAACKRRDPSPRAGVVFLARSSAEDVSRCPGVGTTPVYVFAVEVLDPCVTQADLGRYLLAIL